MESLPPLSPLTDEEEENLPSVLSYRGEASAQGWGSAPSGSSTLPPIHGNSRREPSSIQAWHKLLLFESIRLFLLQNEMKIPETGQGPGIEISGFQFRTPPAAFWGHCKSTEEKLLEFLLQEEEEEEEKRGAASVLFYCF